MFVRPLLRRRSGIVSRVSQISSEPIPIPNPKDASPQLPTTPTDDTSIEGTTPTGASSATISPGRRPTTAITPTLNHFFLYLELEIFFEQWSITVSSSTLNTTSGLKTSAHKHKNAHKKKYGTNAVASTIMDSVAKTAVLGPSTVCIHSLFVYQPQTTDHRRFPAVFD